MEDRIKTYLLQLQAVRQLEENKKITLETITRQTAEAININSFTLKNYIYRNQIPSIETALQLAEFFSQQLKKEIKIDDIFQLKKSN